MTHILVGFTIRAFVQTGGIMNIGKNAGVYLGIHRFQTCQRGCLVDRRVHSRVVLCIDEPHGQILQSGQLLLGNAAVLIGLADGISCRKVPGILDRHVHGHITAVGAAANKDAVRVDLGMLCHKGINELFQGLGVHRGHARVVAPVPGLVILQPERGGLGQQHIGSPAHGLLELVTEERRGFVAQKSNRRILAALSCTVEPDDQRQLLTLRCVVAIGQLFAIGAAEHSVGDKLLHLRDQSILVVHYRVHSSGDLLPKNGSQSGVFLHVDLQLIGLAPCIHAYQKVVAERTAGVGVAGHFQTDILGGDLQLFTVFSAGIGRCYRAGRAGHDVGAANVAPIHGLLVLHHRGDILCPDAARIQ